MKSLKLSFIGLAGAAFFASPSFAALKPGSSAPSFTAQAYLAGKPFTYRLADALRKGPVVVYFFPAVHTAGCNLEAHQFSEAIDDFKALGASVIGITAGNVDELAAFSKETEHCGGKFPVAADPGAKIAKQYDATLAAKPEWSSRTSYVISPGGLITHVYSELNPSQHVKTMLESVKGSGTIRTDQSVAMIVTRQRQIEADARVGRNGWDNISSGNRSDLTSKQQRIFALLDGKRSAADLDRSEQVELANALQWVNALAASAEDERQVCTRERTIGSNRKSTTCSTVGEIRRRREAAQGAMRLGERVSTSPGSIDP